MILFFHCICLLARYIVSNISKSLSKSKVLSDDDEEDNDKISGLPDYLQNGEYMKHPVYKDGTLKFFPPVYVQRFETVVLILKDVAWNQKIRKVVDFGCAELGFFMYLKNIESVTEILEVDIDAELLERCAHKAAPLTCDYLMNKRSKSLDVYILAGSIADYDDHLMGCDAVVGIELIEHLDEEAFNNMPYNIFHRIRPKLAIFTTPNADFNSLFPNFQNMRHKDHKFEWTRKEFFNWTQKVIKLYPEYTARFYGIGAGPEGTENLGCCSQMVVFQRSDDTEPFSSARDRSEGIHSYKLIKHYEYPVHADTRTKEQKIVHEIQFQMSHLNALPTYYNYENNESEIPLSLLKDYVAELCPDDEEFRNILAENGMSLRKKNTSWFLVHADVESSPSDQRFSGEDWLTEEVSENFYDNDDPTLDEGLSWDEEIHLENLMNFKSARSLEELRGGIMEQREVFTNKQAVKLAPGSYDYIIKQKVLAKEVCTTSSSNLYNNCMNGNINIDVDVVKDEEDNDDNDNDGDDDSTRLIRGKSRIPLKRSENRRDKISPDRSFGKGVSIGSQCLHPGF